MRCRMTAVLALATLLGPVSLLQAQQKTETPDAGTISATTELVLVPAQVRGHDGRPLLGLKAEDFVLRSDGKPQPIRVFEPPQPVSAQPVPAPAKPSPPNMFSSVPSGGMPGQILILAFDLVNTKFLDQSRARQDLIKYLETIPPNQRFALVAITQNGLAQVHNFASDPAVLLEALKKIQGSTYKDVSLPAPPDEFNSTQFATQLDADTEDRILNSLFRQNQIYSTYAEKIAARATLTALMQIAQAYAGVPGRKSVIWLTGGMPVLLLDPLAGGVNGSSSLNADPELVSDYEQAFAALNNANIAIYGVDVKGTRINQHSRELNGNYQYGAIGLRRSSGIDSQPVITNDNPGDDAIKVLSAATGGKACTANGGLQDCIDDAIADSSNYYTLGFYVPQDNRKPGWHKLELKLVSGNGSVRSRNTYFLASRTTPSDLEIGRTLRDTAYAKIGYTGIGFTVERKPAGGPSQPAIMRILVPASSVLLSPGHPQLGYDIVTVPLTPDGEPASALRVIHLNLTEQQTQTALTRGWAFSDPVQGSGSQAVKYILRDDGTGRIGSVIVPGEPSAKGS